MDIIWRSAAEEGFCALSAVNSESCNSCSIVTLSHKLIWAFLTGIYRETPLWAFEDQHNRT